MSVDGSGNPCLLAFIVDGPFFAKVNIAPGDFIAQCKNPSNLASFGLIISRPLPVRLRLPLRATIISFAALPYWSR
jgi:hypothetical protein